MFGLGKNKSKSQPNPSVLYQANFESIKVIRYESDLEGKRKTTSIKRPGVIRRFQQEYVITFADTGEVVILSSSEVEEIDLDAHKKENS